MIGTEGLIEVGYQNLKQFRKGHCFMWLADAHDGWSACYEVMAEPHPENGKINIKVKRWQGGCLIPDFHPN